MCYYSTLKQEKGFISDDLLFKILEDCKSLGVKRVSLGGVGEPLLHKNFMKYLKVAKSLGFWTSTTTNCSFLNKEAAEVMIGEKLDRLNLSIYSSNRAEHEKYTGTDTFDQVVENIKYFLELWQASRRETQVNIKFLRIPGVNDYRSFRQFWQPLITKTGLEISIKQPVNWSSRIIFKRARLSFGLRRMHLCNHIRYYLHILHNGEVLPCCNIPEGEGFGEVIFGNVDKDSIIKIWQSEKYLAFKNNHYKGRLSGYRPCKNCSEAFPEFNFLYWVKKHLPAKLTVL